MQMFSNKTISEEKCKVKQKRTAKRKIAMRAWGLEARTCDHNSKRQMMTFNFQLNRGNNADIDYN